MAPRLVKISKFLAKYLRHAPGDIGLTLEPGGWVRVEDLLKAAAANSFPFTRGELDSVVADNDKQRYAFDDTGEKIKANQGHSTEVELTFEAVAPPAVLYHGTADRNRAAILADGLQKMKRHHVHLSADTVTAMTVGQRHGKPIIFAVDAAAMAAAGVTFYRSDNGVWLTDAIPPKYLSEFGG